MNVTPAELATLRASGEKLRLIDVRELDEWNAVRIGGAELIPLSQFQTQATAQLDPAEKIIVYCHHGMRSARAQQYLLAQGYPHVLNLTGGIDAWAQQVDPSIKRY